jgi:hypothetical protein
MHRTILISLGLLGLFSACNVPKPSVPATFRTDISPLLERHCARCHGDQEQESRLELTSLAAVLEGGDSGPAVIPGRPAKSLLLQMISDDTMPPESPHLTKGEIGLIRRWILNGARD